VSVTEQTSIRDVPIRIIEKQPVKVTPKIKVDTKIENEELIVSVKEQPRCRIDKVQIVERTNETTRIGNPGSTMWLIMEYSAAALFAGLGAYLIADANSCEEDPFDPDSLKSSPEMCMGMGIGSLVFSAGFLGLGIWETTKLRDSEEHLGQKEIAKSSRIEDCHSPRGINNIQVNLDLGGGQMLKANTNTAGEAIIKFEESELLDRANPKHATLTIDDKITKVVDASGIIPSEVFNAREQAREKKREELEAIRQAAEIERQKALAEARAAEEQKAKQAAEQAKRLMQACKKISRKKALKIAAQLLISNAKDPYSAKIVRASYNGCYGSIHSFRLTMRAQNSFGAFLVTPYCVVLALDGNGNLLRPVSKTVSAAAKKVQEQRKNWNQSPNVKALEKAGIGMMLKSMSLPAVSQDQGFGCASPNLRLFQEYF